MNKISNSQLFAVLLGVRAFGLICSGLTPSATQMAGAAISIALQFLFAAPMIILYKRYNFSLKNDMLFGRLGKLIYVLFFILWGGESFGNLWNVSKSVYFPVDSSLICAIILAAVCLYCSSLGFSSLCRSSLIITGILLFSVFVLIIGAYPHASLSNYFPDTKAGEIFASGVKNFCSSGELVMLFILLDSHKGKSTKGVTAFFIGSLILTELIYIIEITVLGNLVSISDFPFFTAGAFSQPLSIQRSDSLYMITFTLLCVLTVTLQLVISSLLIRQILPDLKYNTLLSAILMLGVSALLGTITFDISAVMGILIIILSVILPLIMLGRRAFNEKNHSDVNSNADSLRMQS